MITKTIGQNYRSTETDILTVKNKLSKMGFYELPEYGLTPYADKKLYDAIKSFQQANEIKASGIIRPGDKTDKALNTNSSARFNNEAFDDADFGDEGEESPDNKGPILRCIICGGPHGGSKGSICPPCDSKS